MTTCNINMVIVKTLLVSQSHACYCGPLDLLWAFITHAQRSLSAGVLSNIPQVLLPVWHSKVSLNALTESPELNMSTSHFIHLRRARERVAVQHFTFVLTDLEGCQRFGFCRLANNTNTCLCILRYVCTVCGRLGAVWRHDVSPFKSILIAVTFHGLKCFTNFSTTWLISSQKDRWGCSVFTTISNPRHEYHWPDGRRVLTRPVRRQPCWPPSTSSPYLQQLDPSLCRW